MGIKTKGYYLEKRNGSKSGIEAQLNDWYDSGFEWVETIDKYFVFKKRDEE